MISPAMWILAMCMDLINNNGNYIENRSDRMGICMTAGIGKCPVSVDFVV